MDKKEIFLNKYCKLEKKDGFILNGFVDDITDYGVWFTTNQKTSFISFDNIKELMPEEGD